MPESVNSTEPYMYYFFSCTCMHMLKFNIQVGYSNITNRAIITYYKKSYVNMVSQNIVLKLPFLMMWDDTMSTWLDEVRWMTKIFSDHAWLWVTETMDEEWLLYLPLNSCFPLISYASANSISVTEFCSPYRASRKHFSISFVISLLVA